MTAPMAERIPHDRLSPSDIAGLRRLFDAEYRRDFGEWDPDQPYGYAPHDLHVISRRGGEIVAHVGWAQRRIGVGDVDLVIGGVGGMLVSSAARGLRLGQRLLAEVAQSMRDASEVSFGYLGCRDDVVPFYAASGWQRIAVVESSVSRVGDAVTQAAGPPILVLPLRENGWPSGAVDLRGRAW